MSSLPPEKSPSRLDERPDEAGALLRSASHEFSADLNESAGWKALQRRRARRSTAQWVAVGGLALVSLVALLRGVRQDGVTIALTPETHLLPAAETANRAEPATTRAPEPQPIREFVPDTPLRAPEARPPATESACNDLANARRFREAKDCFARLAEGDGLTAQLALLQVARLTAGPLGSPARALALLEQHRERFPQGPLRGEVQQLRVSALAATGEDRRALEESEALLATEWGRPLASELHLMRGRIYQEKLKDCGRAASEYVALLGVPGKAGDEAEFRRAQCLEELGRRKEAVDAYQAYLRRAAPAQSAAAHERITNLSGP